MLQAAHLLSYDPPASVSSEMVRPLHALARLVCGSSDPSALSRADARTLVALSLQHGLGPMLLWRVRRAGGDVSPPSPWAELVEPAYAAAARYVLGASAHAAIQAALDRAGVPAVWLKGFALAHTVYPQPDLRPMDDLDLLVPFRLRRRAGSVVKSLGYHEVEHLTPPLFDGYEAMVGHHLALRGYWHGLVAVEVHFRLLSGEDRLMSIGQHDWFWSGARPCVYDDLRFIVLAPEAHLLYLCAHAILQHGEQDFVLRRYLDLHLLITANPGLDWQAVLDHAADLRWTGAVARALALAREYFDTPLPSGLHAELTARRSPADCKPLAPPPANANRWQYDLGFLRPLSWPARLYVGLRLAFPSPAYMRWRYDLRTPSQIPLSYARRLAAMVPHAAGLLGRLRHGPC